MCTECLRVNVALLIYQFYQYFSFKKNCDCEYLTYFSLFHQLNVKHQSAVTHIEIKIHLKVNNKNKFLLYIIAEKFNYYKLFLVISSIIIYNILRILLGNNRLLD